MKTDTEVTIAYRLIGDEKWSTRAISPDTYFDLDADECPEIDSVPCHAHVIEYFADLRSEEVAATKVVVFESSTKRSRTVTEVFWNCGTNRVIERRDSVGEQIEDWELILDIQISRNPMRWESLRLDRKDDLLRVLSHCFIDQRADGSEHQIDIFIR